ncbi:MAPEG family protein, partial [Mesorhizobium sp. M0036]
FGGLLGVAIIISKTDVTDPLASTMLGARIVQSVIHLVSTSQLAVSLRFTAFAVQMVIGAYWCWLLLI